MTVAVGAAGCQTSEVRTAPLRSFVEEGRCISSTAAEDVVLAYNAGVLMAPQQPTQRPETAPFAALNAYATLLGALGEDRVGVVLSDIYSAGGEESLSGGAQATSGRLAERAAIEKAWRDFETTMGSLGPRDRVASPEQMVELRQRVSAAAANPRQREQALRDVPRVMDQQVARLVESVQSTHESVLASYRSRTAGLMAPPALASPAAPGSQRQTLREMSLASSEPCLACRSQKMAQLRVLHAELAGTEPTRAAGQRQLSGAQDVCAECEKAGGARACGE